MTSRPTARTRGRGPRAIAAVLPKIAEPALRKRGFSAVEIITNWREIVGAQLAEETAPDRLSFPRGARSQGTLHVTAPGPVALEIQHLAPVIVERINGCLGYGAVNRIAVTQGQVAKNPARKARRPARPRAANPVRRAEIEASTAGIDSDDLRDALHALGNSVAAARDSGHDSA